MLGAAFRVSVTSMKVITETSVTHIPVPLRLDESGTIRVGSTRVTVDLVIEEFLEGATPEEIAMNYPITVSEAYGAITWYLMRREEADAYLGERVAKAAELREWFEARDARGIRARIQAAKQKQAAASA